MFTYRCKNFYCQNQFETKKPGLFDGPIRCPKCDSRDVIKLPSAPAIIFKGPGFYKSENKK